MAEIKKSESDKPERLDKILASSGLCTRKEAKMLICAGKVTVNKKTVKSAEYKLTRADEIYLNGKPVDTRRYVFFMVNKPAGYVCSADERDGIPVTSLLPEPYSRRNLFAAGRLDKDTVGLVVLTDDGESAHRWLSPKSHVKKKYFFKCEKPLKDEDKKVLESGVGIGDNIITQPAVLDIKGENPKEGFITITEGKYHQIKRMFKAINNKIIFLERLQFGNLVLDPKLARGDFKEVDISEIDQ